MTPEYVFSISSKFALAGWIVLIVLGRYKQTATIAGKYVFPGGLAMVYLVIIGLHWKGHPGGFGSLFDVEKLFSDHWLLTAGWVHYLAFDLFVGGWEVRDSIRRGISHWWTIPALITTFLFGPIGFMLHLGMRSALKPHKPRVASLRL